MIVLEGFDPAMLVSANKRIHHHERAKVCRYWRSLMSRQLLHGDPLADRVHITIHFRFPTNRRRDVLNLYPYVAKPLVDEAVASGLLEDDDDLHLIGPDLRRDYPNGPHRIRIEIEELA